MTRLFLLMLGYFLAGWGGLKLPFVETHITLVWLPTGIAVAALVRWGRTLLPGVYIAAFLVNLSIGSSWLLAAAIAIGNTLAPLSSAGLLKRLGFHESFDRQKDVAFLVLAASGGMLISAFGGVTSLYLNGKIATEDIGFAVLSWWLGDTVGVMLVAPLLITLTWDNLRHLSRARTELLCWTLMATTIAWFALIHDYGGAEHSLPLAFLTIPFLTWSGLRFGNTGAALAGLGFSLFAAWGTAIGQGGFILSDVRISLFLLWAYMATTVLTGLLVTALQAERLKIEKELRVSTECLKDAQQIANIGSWRLDLVSNELSWSDEIFRLFEIDSSQFSATYEAFLEAIHPDDREAVNRAYTESVASRTPYEITHRLLMRDGRIKWVCERCRTDYDANGKPLCSQGTVQDITERRRSEESLRKLSLAVQQSPSFILITDLNSNIEFANGAFYRATGYEPFEVIGKNPRFLKSGKTPQATYREMWSTLTQGQSWKGEFINRRKDGGEFIELALISPVFQSDGRITHYLAIMEDITERKKAEDDLRIAAATFETHEAIMITDANANILRVNQAFEKITGFPANEVIGKNPRILSSGRHDKAFYEAMWRRLLSTGIWEGEIWDRRKNGEIYPKRLMITALKDLQSQPTEYIAIFTDITERKQAEEEIRNLAFFDPLTKLPNRRLLMDLINFALSASERSEQCGALLFLDMDRFKSLNDIMGHSTGDKMLIEVAKRIKFIVGEADTVARFGGDEFVILFEDLGENLESASHKMALIAEKIRAALAVPFHFEQHVHSSSPSIGVCMYHGQDVSADDLIKRADIAMYQAKQSGRNKVQFFDPFLQKSVETRAALESDLRRALANEQLQLYYQVQYDNEDRPFGAEALIRWKHPERGIISPAQFIPIAEESALIVAIGQWVLETACQQLTAWSQKYATQNLLLAINVSPYQFMTSNFVESVEATLRAYGANPSCLKLELTESVILNDIDDVVDKMQSLKALGIRLSLDDFGTGYSSLSYLKRLPIDQIKIDQSFVRDVVSDPNDAVMVKNIIDIAKNFNLNVIAEGVETEEQLEFLRQNGCMAYQGYLFGKPLPIDRFEEQLKTQHTLIS
jgi:diguanylate cyclase (GGDEF)-like protein/PAS domain S-box-containing protein